MSELITADDLAAKLFDDDFSEVPDELSHISASEFYDAVIGAKTERGYSAKIKVHADWSTETGAEIMTLVDRVRETHSEDDFKKFWNCFSMNLDVSVMGGDVWAPRILTNGAVLIRNHHRVIALSEAPEGVLYTDNTQLLEDLKVFESYAQANYEADDINFSILHRAGDSIVWTRTLPAKLSDFGQTLVLMSNELIESVRDSEDYDTDYNSILESNAIDVAMNSRTGFVAIRVFEKQSYMYSNYRADDKYDSLLESYSYYLGSSPDEDVLENPEVSIGHTDVEERIRNWISEMDYSLFDEPKMAGKDELKSLILQDLTTNYARQKTWETLGFTPFFAKEADKPTNYYQDTSIYWNQSAKMDHDMFVLSMTPTGVQDADELVDELSRRIETVVDNAGYLMSPEPVKVYISARNPDAFKPIPEEHIVDYGSAEMETRLQEFVTSLQEAHEKDIEDNEEEYSFGDFLDSYGYEYTIAVLVPTEASPDPREIHQIALDVTSELEISMMMEVPRYGICQGYDCGELDTGNVAGFVVESEDDEDSFDEDDE